MSNLNFYKHKSIQPQIEILGVNTSFKRYKFYVEKVTDTDCNSRQMINKSMIKSVSNTSFMFDEKNELYYNTLYDAINSIKTIISHLGGYWAYLKIAEVLVEDKTIKVNKETKVKRFYTKILKSEYTYVISQYKALKTNCSKVGRPRKQLK